MPSMFGRLRSNTRTSTSATALFAIIPLVLCIVFAQPGENDT
jgi:hypothetical protein